VEHVRLEIITDEAKAEKLAGYIMKEGYTGDGLVAILPQKMA
jgi:hypothetical protein